MAHADWKRYYAPIMVHKISGECRIWYGKLFTKPERAAIQCFKINDCPKANWRCIGVAAIRGNRRNPKLQTWLKENSR